MSTKTNVVKDEQFPILLANGRGVQRYTLKAAKELLVNLSASIKIVEKRRANSEQGEPKPLPTTQVKTPSEELTQEEICSDDVCEYCQGCDVDVICIQHNKFKGLKLLLT